MDPYPPPSMTLSPQSPATGSGSASNAVFRPRRSDDWNEYRDLIEQLYRNDQLKLRDVKRIMERQHNFIASEKQYKDRLAAWNVRKNIKAAEVQVLIRKKQKRAARGKQTAFRRAGHEVDQKRLTRFVRRYGSGWVDKPRDKDAELASPEPTTETPSDMSCYTPEPEEVEAATPVSPPDLHSPTTETPPFPVNYDPNNLSTMPDLVIGDDQPYQHAHAHAHAQAQAHAHAHAMSLPPHSQSHTHSNPPPRRPYHPSELASPHPHTHAHTHTHPYTHTHPSVHSIIHSTHHPITLSPVHQPVHHQPVHHPVVTSVAPAPATHAPTQNRDDLDAPGELETHSDDWNRLDTFQTRLEGLHVRLERSMSKWAQAQDPNAEISHHEGLGL